MLSSNKPHATSLDRAVLTSTQNGVALQNVELAGGRDGRCRRRPSVRRLFSRRRHAKAKSAVRTAGMLELPRTNLGGERVASGIGESLYPLHESEWGEKAE